MLTLLEAAFKLVKNPETWTTETFARNSEGLSVNSSDPTACKFCSEGAVHQAAHENGCTADERYDALDKLQTTAERLYGESLVYCNDMLPHEKVLEIWKEAMK
jgi:tRNA U34 5-methylaminomethyl-2-thiouridine-forming methyltransferase MnmC